MHFQNTRRNVTLSQNIIIDNIPLNQEEYVKFLGITIDKHLSWGQHINNVSSSIAKGIGILYKTFLARAFSSYDIQCINFAVY